MANGPPGRIPTGTATMLRVRAGPRPAAIPANRIATVQATSSNRQRAGSPTAYGTIRDVGGKRQAVPLPNRHRQPARDGSFEGPVPTASRVPYRQPVLHFPQTPRLPPVQPTPQVPRAPRLTPVQPALKVAQAPLSPVQPVLQGPQAPRLAPVQPVLQVSQVPQAGDWPAPLNINKDICQPASLTSQATLQSDNDFRSPREKETEKQKVEMILDAISTHRLLSLMLDVYQDGVNIHKTKVQVRVCAVNTSEPDAAVKNKGEQWVTIFHALRKDFISRAIEIAYMAEEDQEKQLKSSTDKYFEFEKLFANVLEARAVVEESLQSDQKVQDKWISKGKKDVLDRVVEKEAALDAEMERESDPQTPNSGIEANMTIQVEITIQQTYERLNSQAPAAKSTGVFTSISGPVTGGLPVRYGAALDDVLQACCTARQASLMSQQDSSDEEL
jgi:hypothetical protein